MSACFISPAPPVDRKSSVVGIDGRRVILVSSGAVLDRDLKNTHPQTLLALRMSRMSLMVVWVMGTVQKTSRQQGCRQTENAIFVRLPL